MAEPEEMEALKKVYAEMILNTAKEAAARVMAAEFRSRQLEHDLVSAKEEAARMLFRLKQVTDAKMKEADTRSLNQQRKFDEVESQLNEAEGIILDLRAELDQAQDQLVEVKSKKLLCTRQKEITELHNMTPKGTCNDHEFSSSSLNSGPDFFTSGCNNLCSDWITLNPKHRSPAKQSMKFTPDCDVYSGSNHPILEPELFKNGCTQRICAVETSLVPERFPIVDELNPSKNLTDSDFVNAVGSTSVSEENAQYGKHKAVSVVRRSIRKRKLKYWDDVITACGLSRSNQFKKPHQALPDLPCNNTSNIKSGEDQFQAEDETKTEEGLYDAKCPIKELTNNEALPEIHEVNRYVDKTG